MRYEMVRLAQLVFALSLMFGAFLAGLTIGWLRWGRLRQEARTPARVVPRPEPVVPRVIKSDLFSPQFEGEVVDVTATMFSPPELTASTVDRPTGAAR